MTPTPVAGSPAPHAEAGLPRVIIRWPDGSMIRGHDDADVLAKFARIQWDEGARADIRTALATRVAAFSGTFVDPATPDPGFLDALAATGMIVVDRS